MIWWAFGSGGTGALGVGTMDDTAMPMQIDFESPSNVVQVIPGGRHSLFLTDASILLACGANEFGQSSPQSECVEVKIPRPVRFHHKVRIAACGWSHSIVLTMDGDVYSWGSNSYGQLGLITSERCVRSPRRIDTTALHHSAWQNVSCGRDFSFVIDSDGQAFGSGNDRLLQLGTDAQVLKAICQNIYDTVNMPNISGPLRDRQLAHIVPRFVPLSLPFNTNHIECGWRHCAALTQNNVVYTWGSNDKGQLGRESEKTPGRPARVVLPSDVSCVRVGWHFTLALCGNTQILGWGSSHHGQIGFMGGVALRPTNISTSALGTNEFIHLLQCGSESAMCITTKGRVFTWGWNEHGNLGSSQPTDFSSVLANVTAFGAGSECGLAVDGACEGATVFIRTA